MPTLDDIILETLRNTYGDGKIKASKSTRGGGFDSQGARNRGKPGYPVPDVLATKVGTQDDGEEHPRDVTKESKQEHKGTFVAVKIPLDVAKLLAFPGGEKPEDMHVTLLYINGLSEKQKEGVAECAAALAAEYLPTPAVLGGVGRFSASHTSDGKDVIYVSVDSPGLTRMRTALAILLATNGIVADQTHGFTPHVTIMYVDQSVKTPFSRINPIPTTLCDLIVSKGSIDEGELMPKSPNMDDPSKDPNREFSDVQGDEDAPKGAWIGESVSPQKKGIAHLEDLPPEKLLSFLRKFVSKKGLEASEKVDGSAKITFGVDKEGKVWTQSKNGSKIKEASGYDGRSANQALKFAHESLAPAGPGISAFFETHEIDPESVSLTADVLHTKVPNSIEYGDDAIVVHGSDVPEPMVKTLLKVIEPSVKGLKLHYKNVIDQKELDVDLKEELESLEKDPGKYEQVRESTKKKLLSKTSERKSAYGPDGGDIEGVVFKDLESGELVKLVDQDYFTKLNKFMWKYRELLTRGHKDGDKWIPGVMAKFNTVVADDVIKAPVFKSPGFVRYVVSHSEKSKDVDKVLVSFIEKNKLMPGNFEEKLAKANEQLKQDINELSGEWSKSSKSIKLKSKEFKMDVVIGERTEKAFEEALYFSTVVDQALETIRTIDDPLAKRAALLKVVMGQTKLERLEGQLQESRKVIKEADEPESTDLAGNIGQLAPTIFKKYAKQLQSKGLNLSKPVKLGGGSWGIAFDCGSGKVLKLTADASEAKTSNHIKGKKLKHIVHIMDVFTFKEKIQGNNVYGIIEEKLKPLDEDEKAAFMTLVRMLRMISAGPEMMKGDFQGMVAKAIHRQNEEWAEDFVHLSKIFNFDIIIKELADSQIQFMDYHSENIMKRGEAYVVIDLGVSRSPGAEPPMIEDVTEELVKEIDQAVYNSMFEDWTPADADDVPGNVLDIAQALASLHDSGVGGATEKIVDAFRKHRPALEKRGIDLDKLTQLGAGSYGVACNMGNGKVLKLTTDPDEARSSQHLVGKKLKHVVHMFDVFKIPLEGINPIYGIIEEKLSPLSGDEKVEMEEYLPSVSINTWETAKSSADLLRVMYAKLYDRDEPEKWTAFKDFFDQCQIGQIFDELTKAKITFYDYHSENILKRGKDFVVIDLGVSRSPGKEPAQIESIIREVFLSEAKADTVGLTIGRFQPFHKGHATIIRQLANKYSKVVILVAGLKKDQKNPFSYELRLDMLKESLPDILPKLEVFKAEFEGKQSGYIPGIVSELIVKKSSSVKLDTAVTIAVGEDRYNGVRQQIDHARAQKDDKNKLLFDPDMMTVDKVAGIRNDDDADRISGTRVRQSIESDDKDAVQKMMDPHLMSKEGVFDDLFERMRDELGVKKESLQLQEKIEDLGGEQGIQKIVDANADALKRSKWNIDVTKLTKMGRGMEGVAYDMGNGRVLKITADEKEAQASYQIVGKNLESVAHIFDVFRFRDKVGTETKPAYGVVEEKLTPLSDAEIKEFQMYIDFIETPAAFDALRAGDWEGLKKAIMDQIDDDVKTDLGIKDGGPADPATTKQWQEIRTQKFQAVMKVFNKYNLQGMMKDLKASQIGFVDYHGGNIMKRGTRYVINDLGKSRSLNREPPTLESLVTSVANSITEDVYGGFGQHHAGPKAGSSGWSAPQSQMTDDDVQAKEDGEDPLLWQTQLAGLQSRTHITGRKASFKESAGKPKKS